MPRNRFVTIAIRLRPLPFCRPDGEIARFLHGGRQGLLVGAGLLQQVKPTSRRLLREKNESPTAKFSVLLIYAGYGGASSDQDPLVLQDEAKERARVLRDTLQRWSRLSKENWVKDLGHDRGTTIGCYKLYLLKAIDND